MTRRAQQPVEANLFTDRSVPSDLGSAFLAAYLDVVNVLKTPGCSTSLVALAACSNELRIKTGCCSSKCIVPLTQVIVVARQAGN